MFSMVGRGWDLEILGEISAASGLSFGVDQLIRFDLSGGRWSTSSDLIRFDLAGFGRIRRIRKYIFGVDAILILAPTKARS